MWVFFNKKKTFIKKIRTWTAECSGYYARLFPVVIMSGAAKTARDNRSDEKKTSAYTPKPMFHLKGHTSTWQPLSCIIPAASHLLRGCD